MRPTAAAEARRLAHPSRLFQSDSAAAHCARHSAAAVHDDDSDGVGDPVVLVNDLGVLVPAVLDRRYPIGNGRCLVHVGPLAAVVGRRAAVLRRTVILHVGIELFLVVFEQFA